VRVEGGGKKKGGGKSATPAIHERAQ